MIRLHINGREEELDVRTLEQLVQHYELKAEHVVAEVNGEIVERSEWPSYELEAGMRIELVHFVGGG